MRRELFNKIVRTCESNTLYFKQKRNCVGLLGFSAHQNISAVMRVLAYGIPADYTDELRIGEDTTMESVRRFCKVMIRKYKDIYLRAPNEQDTVRLMAQNEARGWPGMLGSIDCSALDMEELPEGISWHILWQES
jgi:hypothetical protein